MFLIEPVISIDAKNRVRFIETNITFQVDRCSVAGVLAIQARVTVPVCEEYSETQAESFVVGSLCYGI